MIDLIVQNVTVRALALLAIFGLVVLGSFVLIGNFNRRAVVRGQVEKLTAGARKVRAGPGLRVDVIESGWSRLAKTIEDAGLNLTDTNQERLTKTLREAGFSSPSAPKIYTLVRLCMIFVLPLTYVALAYSSGEPPSFTRMYMIGTGLALLGLFGPSLYVRARADRRREEIVNGFPDCLDLMLVCVESGLGLEAALDRVGREMVLSHPKVAELLSITTLQLRAGASREEAFRKLADASGVDDIRSFTTLIIQSDKLGTSIATTLRVYAAEMREKRRMRAEEKAHRLPVLISIPLVACMLPTMIGTLMLPAVVMVAREIFPLMAGR
jgi:tight adherence protein C